MPDNPDLLLSALRFTLLRELKSLDAQVAAYPDDESLWLSAPGISNSGGTLALHLAGNLRHFFGASLGGTGYLRDRAAEFATRGLSREQVRAEVQAAVTDVERSLERVDAGLMAAAFPHPVAERRVRTAEFLVHLASHLAYHLGQIDYHRRILTADPVAVENLGVRELPVADQVMPR